MHSEINERTNRYASLLLVMAAAVLALALTLTFLGSGNAVAAPADTLNVDGNDPLCNDLVGTPYCTIGAATDDAVDGDEVVVAAGVYTENVEIAGKSISVTGAGYTQTIVNGDDADRVFFIHDGNVALEDLAIINGHAPGGEPWGGGVWFTNGTFTMTRVAVMDNVNGGVEANSDFGPTHLTMVDGIVSNNQGNQGFSIGETFASGTVVNALIVGNTGGGVRVSSGNMDAGWLAIHSSTIADNPGGNGIDVGVGGAFTMTNSIASAIDGGQALNCAGNCTVTYSNVEGGWPGEGNIDANPFFVDPDNDDYHLLAFSPAIDAGTAAGAPDHDLDGNARPLSAGFDMGAYEFTGTPVSSEGDRYVAPDGDDGGPNICTEPSDPCATVQHAVDFANDGESVLVAGGTYTENLIIDRPISVTGGFEPISWTRSLTLYESLIDGSATAETVVVFQGGVDGAILDGFTLSGGDVNQAGGGVTVIEGSSPALRNLTITGNHADGTDEWGAGGLLIGDGSQASIENSIIMSNTADGGAGGVRLGGASATFVNTLITDNPGRQAVHLNNAAITLTHVTVSGHGEWGGVLIGTSSTGTVLNSIIWEEEGEDLFLDGTSTATISYSDLEDGVYTGTGNISADPRFVDPPSGDYHLGVGSPAIGAALPAGAPPADLDGVPRDASPDMGAYEWVGFRTFLPAVLK